MSDHLSELVDALLWEGYALYPYTPGAAKNATPTPFGIVYPPAYAARLPSTFHHLELRCALEAPPDAVLTAEVHFLVAGGGGHRAHARRVELPGAMAGGLAVPAIKHVSVPCPDGSPPLTVSLTLSAGVSGARNVPDGRVSRPAGGAYEVVLRVENRTVVSSGLDRRGALTRSLLSTHPVLRVTGGRFVSPLEAPCGSVNTFPVLATPADDVVIGAAIVLPDHPQIAPESRGALFDSTEIEEALLLHVQALTDAERREIEEHDPAVREMIARAAQATPQDLAALHGRVTLRDPETRLPPAEPPDLVDPRAGEAAVDVGGVTFRRGAKAIIRPRPGADLEARLLDGRTATIERIFTAYDGRVHLAVTIDDDPGQELMRETGRFRFFFAPELEVIET